MYGLGRKQTESYPSCLTTRSSAKCLFPTEPAQGESCQGPSKEQTRAFTCSSTPSNLSLSNSISSPSLHQAFYFIFSHGNGLQAWLLHLQAFMCRQWLVWLWVDEKEGTPFLHGEGQTTTHGKDGAVVSPEVRSAPCKDMG